MTKSHSKPFFFRSAAISRCFCSMASLILVASLYSFFSKLLVTCSHNFRDSFGCCRDSGRTDLGTTCKIDRSIRVFHSYRFAWFVRGGHKGTYRTLTVSPIRLHRIRCFHDPSIWTTTSSFGTCFTRVHDSCVVSFALNVCTTASRANSGLPSHDCGYKLNAESS